MKIEVHRAHFSSPEEALDEIASAGLHPLEMDVPPVDNDSHWHRFSTRIFMLGGALDITDSARGKRFTARRGDRVDVPERVLHSEHSPGGYRIIAGMTVDPGSLTGDVDLEPRLLEAGHES